MESHDHDAVPHDLPKISKTVLVLLAVAVLVFFVGMFLWGYLPARRHQREMVELAEQRASAAPVVNVAPPKPLAATTDLNLPGSASAWQETALFPRVNGYLKEYKVDIGDRVTKGQLLIEISAPDTDASLAQSQASLQQAKANVTSAKTNYDLSEATYERYNGLVASGSVTQQQLDQVKSAAATAQASVAASEAAVDVAQANVQRLTELQKFEQIFAPFDGVITARNYDTGALVTADSPTGRPIFTIADVHELRVWAQVPQSYVTLLQPHQKVTMSVRNYPGKVFEGFLDRTTGALDQTTRTLMAQLDFDNPDGLLYAGMYSTVTFKMHTEKPTLTVPTSALMFESDGTQVALVQDGKLHFRKVKVGRDYGTEIEVVDGLNGDEQVVTNPGERIEEGGTVQIASTQKPAAASGPADGQKSASTQPSGGSGDNNAQAPRADRVAQSDTGSVAADHPAGGSGK